MASKLVTAFYERDDGRTIRVMKSGARAEDVIDAVYGELSA